MSRPRTHLLSIILLVLTVLAVGCSQSDRDSPAGTGDDAPLTDPEAIRQFDLATTSSATTAARSSSSTPDIPAIIYTDVTGDGQEEAIVPFSSGGSQGYVLYQVYKVTGHQPGLVLTRTPEKNSGGGIRMTVPEGVLTETMGVFANEDPLCCPSQLKRTTFKWDGTKLQVASENVVANPNAPKG